MRFIPLEVSARLKTRVILAGAQCGDASYSSMHNALLVCLTVMRLRMPNFLALEELPGLLRVTVVISCNVFSTIHVVYSMLAHAIYLRYH